jgi:hypothetical protein
VESGGPSVGKVGECDVESQQLQGCSSRLCQLRTEGLVHVSKYWMYRSHVGDMGPVSLVAGCSQNLVFSPCFIGYYGREAGYGPADWSAGVMWVGFGALLLGSSGSIQICLWLRKRLLCIDRVKYIWSGTMRRLGVGCVWHVARVSPTGCTLIRITVTLGYE